MSATWLLEGSRRFQLRRCLGEGGMGIVYEAEDTERGEIVALKAMPDQDAETIYRTKQEFRALADLEHPNLVRLYDLVVEREQCFFTMELIDGVDFLLHCAPKAVDPGAKTLRRDEARNYDEDRLRRALVQLARGLDALHDAGKVHRDVKPPNVLVTAEGRVVLLDFGLTRDMNAVLLQSDAGGIVGTAAYMSPEQARGEEELTPATDWYSVGVILFEALTGKRPHEGTLFEILAAKQRPLATSPSQLDPGCPSDLEALCKDLLDVAPERRPRGDEVLLRLGVASDDVRSRVTSRSGLVHDVVGRDAELRMLRDASAAVAPGRPVLAHVHGRSGLGKTTLIHHFLRELQRRDGALVLASRCYPQESIPYRALDGIVDGLARHLRGLSASEVEAHLPPDVETIARLFPVLRRVKEIAERDARADHAAAHPTDVRVRAFRALRELIASLAAQRLVVLFIDDAQWGDADSAALLGDMLRVAVAPPILLLSSARTGAAEGSPLLQVLERVANASAPRAPRQLVSLEPLSLETSALVAASLLGCAPDSADAAWIAQESKGFPLVIEDLARVAASAGGGRGTTASRFAALATDAQRLVAVVALAGEPVPTTIALRAAELDDGDQALTHRLRAGHWLRAVGAGRGDGLDTFHDRVREQVIEVIPADRARAIHARLAAAFEGSERPPFDRLANHLARAGDLARASRYAVRAAEEAAGALAFERAVTLHRMAVSIAAPPERAKLLPALAGALSIAGRTLEAAELHLEIAEASAGSERLEHRRLAADELLRGGRIERALELLSEIAGELGIPIAKRDFGALVGFAFRRAQIALRGLDYEAKTAEEIPARTLTRLDTVGTVATSLAVADPLRGAIAQSRYLLDALDAGEETRICRALAVDASLRAALGSDEAATRLAQQITKIAQRLGDPSARMWAEAAMGVCAHCDYRFETAAEHFANVLRLQASMRTVTHWDRTTIRLYRCFAAQYYCGAYRTGASELEEAIEDAHRRSDLHASAVLRSTPLTYLLLADDRPGDAFESLATALDGWPKSAYYLMHYFVEHARVVVLQYVGRAAEAADLAATIHAKAAAAGHHRIALIREDGVRLVAATSIAAGRFDVGRSHVRRLHQLKYAAVRGNAHLLEASLAAHRDDRESAHQHLLEATELFQRAKTAAWLATARHRLGVLVGGAEGEALLALARGWSEAEGIVAPEKVYALHCPWPGAAAS